MPPLGRQLAQVAGRRPRTRGPTRGERPHTHRRLARCCPAGRRRWSAGRSARCPSRAWFPKAEARGWAGVRGPCVMQQLPPQPERRQGVGGMGDRSEPVGLPPALIESNLHRRGEDGGWRPRCRQDRGLHGGSRRLGCLRRPPTSILLLLSSHHDNPPPHTSASGAMLAARRRRCASGRGGRGARQTRSAVLLKASGGVRRRRGLRRRGRWSRALLRRPAALPSLACGPHDTAAARRQQGSARPCAPCPSPPAGSCRSICELGAATSSEGTCSALLLTPSPPCRPGAPAFTNPTKPAAGHR